MTRSRKEELLENYETILFTEQVVDKCGTHMCLSQENCSCYLLTRQRVNFAKKFYSEKEIQEQIEIREISK